MCQPFITPHFLSQAACFTNETLFLHGQFTKAEDKRVEESVCRVPFYLIDITIEEKLKINMVMCSFPDIELMYLLKGCFQILTRNLP